MRNHCNRALFPFPEVQSLSDVPWDLAPAGSLLLCPSRLGFVGLVGEVQLCVHELMGGAGKMLQRPEGFAFGLGREFNGLDAIFRERSTGVYIPAIDAQWCLQPPQRNKTREENAWSGRFLLPDCRAVRRPGPKERVSYLRMKNELLESLHSPVSERQGAGLLHYTPF